MTLPELKDQLKALNLPIAYRCLPQSVKCQNYRILYTMRTKILDLALMTLCTMKDMPSRSKCTQAQKDLQLEKKVKERIKREWTPV